MNTLQTLGWADNVYNVYMPDQLPKGSFLCPKTKLKFYIIYKPSLDEPPIWRVINEKRFKVEVYHAT